MFIATHLPEHRAGIKAGYVMQTSKFISLQILHRDLRWYSIVQRTAAILKKSNPVIIICKHHSKYTATSEYPPKQKDHFCTHDGVVMISTSRDKLDHTNQTYLNPLVWTDTLLISRYEGLQFNSTFQVWQSLYDTRDASWPLKARSAQEKRVPSAQTEFTAV